VNEDGGSFDVLPKGRGLGKVAYFGLKGELFPLMFFVFSCPVRFWFFVFFCVGVLSFFGELVLSPVYIILVFYSVFSLCPCHDALFIFSPLSADWSDIFVSFAF